MNKQTRLSGAADELRKRATSFNANIKLPVIWYSVAYRRNALTHQHILPLNNILAGEQIYRAKQLLCRQGRNLNVVFNHGKDSHGTDYQLPVSCPDCIQTAKEIGEILATIS